MRSFRTIKELVIDEYNSQGTMPSYEKLTSLVKQYFPNSRWKKTHYAWYKSKIKSGQISGISDDVSPDQLIADDAEDSEVDRQIEDALETRVSVERDLHDYLWKNLIQLDPSLRLHERGVEFSTDAGRIDILAKDGEGKFVVIEIKAGEANTAALGQLLGYIGCLTPDHGQVRGILVASDFEDKVVFACQALPNIRLVKYALRFGFEPVNRKPNTP